ncbi:diguanylate cyclase (GGDEF) domain-containing protein [Micromonospora nigra]|uniref:Diguanylate cyclase (GGDEF) domain-containing protein n=1 Tax=Micromonospora nigra TaxID=145857 RepID=A0A1C6R7B8_9ACTN|nr:GGDEF domain-containing protein [Micromonospora nigra]SCL12933.1 diguanylate cyclase (GGDEF) domain-containing protein [Micromonospora nigra]
MLGHTEILLGTTTASCFALIWRCARLRADLATAQHDANHDPLTGLPNRRALLAHLRALLADRTRPVTVALLDLNRFKDINDEHGHSAGDAVLRRVAQALAALDLPAAYVGRLSGDEFLIITDGGCRQGRANAQAAARALAAATVTLDGTAVGCAASVGVAIADHNDTTAEQLLHRADTAMYCAKREGVAVMEHRPFMEAKTLTANGSQRRRFR